MLTTFLIGGAIALRFAAGISYLLSTMRGRVTPNPVSWFFWGAIPLLAFSVQLLEGVGIQAFATLALGVIPIAIFSIAMKRRTKKLRFSFVEKTSAVLATTGIILWLSTGNPLAAIFFCILADIASGVPTIIKSWQQPDSEPPLPYLLSLVSMLMTLATIRQWDAMYIAFPLYTALSNMMFFTLITSRVGVWWQQRQFAFARQSVEE